MTYVCGKSSSKIVHNNNCRYVKLIPSRNRKAYAEIESAVADGYSYCKYCSRIGKLLKMERKDLPHYCKRNGIFYFFNAKDGTIDIISHSGKWKIIAGKKKHSIILCHKNVIGNETYDILKGYHIQNVKRRTILGYMKYISQHDRYREAKPIFEDKSNSNIKGVKKKKKDVEREKRIRRAMSIHYVEDILDNMSSGNIPY